jgi:hypothetical protein
MDLMMERDGITASMWIGGLWRLHSRSSSASIDSLEMSIMVHLVVVLNLKRDCIRAENVRERMIEINWNKALWQEFLPRTQNQEFSTAQSEYVDYPILAVRIRFRKDEISTTCDRHHDGGHTFIPEDAVANF